jgi:DNA-binding MarR family transcriptional regulator
MRSLVNDGPATIRALSIRTGVSHSAASQTVSQMVERGLLALQTGDDARERIVALTPIAVSLIPRLEQLWAATEAAARTLDDELGRSLPDVLRATLDLLDRKPFGARIAAATTSRSKALP